MTKAFCAACGKVNNTSNSEVCSAICGSILATRRAELHRFVDPATLHPIIVETTPVDRAEKRRHQRPAVVFVKLPPRVTAAQLEAAERAMRKPWWRRFLDWMLEPVDIRDIE